MFKRTDSQTTQFQLWMLYPIIGRISKHLRLAAAVSLCLLSLTAGAARAADNGLVFVKINQGPMIDLGAGRSIIAWITSHTSRWRAGDRLQLQFSRARGITVTDLRSRAQASVIGLTNVVNPIDSAFRACLSIGKETTIRDEGCYETWADNWHSQVHAMLKLGQVTIPTAIMDNLAQNHATLRDVNLASLTATQRRFSEAVENLVIQGETVNRNLSFVGGTGWSVSGNATDAAFLARINGILWAQLRQASDSGKIFPRHATCH
jgi:hypothetical protein